MIKPLVHFAFAAGLVTATLLPASAAQAAPANCQGSYVDNGYAATCTGGTGSYRATIECYRNGRPVPVTRYGTVQKAGSGPSVARCYDFEDAAIGGVDRWDS